MHKFMLHFKKNISKSTKVNKNFNIFQFNKNNFKFTSFKNIKNFSEEINQEKDLYRKFDEDFEKCLSMNEEDQEKRVRLLSFKLLQINNSKEILNLFDEKYIKGLVSNIYGEEVALIIYFYVSVLNREFSDHETNPLKTPRIYGNNIINFS